MSSANEVVNFVARQGVLYSGMKSCIGRMCNFYVDDIM